MFGIKNAKALSDFGLRPGFGEAGHAADLTGPADFLTPGQFTIDDEQRRPLKFRLAGRIA